MDTTALSSAGSAEGGGGEPAGGGGVYAHSGRPPGMGAAGAGAACCATIDAPRITTAIAPEAPAALRMVFTFDSWLAETRFPRSLHRAHRARRTHRDDRRPVDIPDRSAQHPLISPAPGEATHKGDSHEDAAVVLERHPGRCDDAHGDDLVLA